MEPLNIRKLANAFIPYATPSDALPSAALSAAQRFKRKHGGLWVGGTVLATSGGVSFAPNGLNRALHEDLEAIDVPAGDIKTVRHEFGWFTGIVVVTHPCERRVSLSLLRREKARRNAGPEFR